MEIEADDLWAVEPGSFVAERDALAKRLRAAGDKEAATAVKARRRPPVSAWALNAVARAEPDLVTAVLEAGAALQAALEGGAAARDDRAAAQQAERQATDALVNAASSAIVGIGQQATEAIKGRMVQTIRAAQLDDEVAGRLRAGTLAEDETPSVFGLSMVAGADAPARTERATTTGPAKRSARTGRSVVAQRRIGASADADRPDETGPSPQDAPHAEAVTPLEPAKARSTPRPKVDKAAAKAERERARAARVALAHQQDEARRLAKRADRLEERAKELAADARAAADQAAAARSEADRAADALAAAEAADDAPTDADAGTETDDN